MLPYGQTFTDYCHPKPSKQLRILFLTNVLVRLRFTKEKTANSR